MPDITTLVDLDDSIVLSDLLRTGEASRLRRRGAMRIDHTNHNHHTTSAGHVLPGPPRLSPPNFVLIERSNSDSDSDLDSPSFTSYSNFDPPSTNRPGRRHLRSSRRFGPYSSPGLGQQPKDEYPYSLLCGSEASTCDDEDQQEPFVPSVLPLYPPPMSSLSPSKRQRQTKKSTGCGSLVHLHAAPKSRFRMWTAKSSAAESVLPLDGEYFDEKEASRFTTSPCGCVSEGVGCAIWYVYRPIHILKQTHFIPHKSGNPLGMRYTPCTSASEGFLCPRLLDKHSPISSAPPPPPSHTDPPASPKQPHTKPSQCIYTFFADAVTPSPAYAFPPPPVRPARSRSGESPSGSPARPTSPPLVTPERYLYSPDDDDDESDAENYPPFPADTDTGAGSANAWGWRSIDESSSVFPLVEMDVEEFTVPPVSMLAPPAPDPAPDPAPAPFVLFDRVVDAAPASMTEEDHQQLQLQQQQEQFQQPWGINLPSPLRTRTGRTARWSSIGRSFPSLSSSVGRPVSPLSFFDRQLMVASEREGRPGDGVGDESGARQVVLDRDGVVVSDVEYKPENAFDR